MKRLTLTLTDLHNDEKCHGASRNGIDEKSHSEVEIGLMCAKFGTIVLIHPHYF